MIILISSLKSYFPKKERLPQTWNKANHKLEQIPSRKDSGCAVCPALCASTAQCQDIRAPQGTLQTLPRHSSTRTGSHLVRQRGTAARSYVLHFKKCTFYLIAVKQLPRGERHMLQGTLFRPSLGTIRRQPVDSEWILGRGEMILHREMQQHLVFLTAFSISPLSLGLCSVSQVPFPALSGMGE